MSGTTILVLTDHQRRRLTDEGRRLYDEATATVRDLVIGHRDGVPTVAADDGAACVAAYERALFWRDILGMLPGTALLPVPNGCAPERTPAHPAGAEGGDEP